jgi:hypothetical protein
MRSPCCLCDSVSPLFSCPMQFVPVSISSFPELSRFLFSIASHFTHYKKYWVKIIINACHTTNKIASVV